MSSTASTATHSVLRDFSNSTFEEVLASQTPFRSKTPRSQLTASPEHPHDDNFDGDTANKEILKKSRPRGEEQEIDVAATRWDYAEQRFLELFFGQDLSLRARQRHQHVVTLMKMRHGKRAEVIKKQDFTRPGSSKVTATRPKSAVKAVSFNLRKNLKYDFQISPRAHKSESEEIGSRQNSTSISKSEFRSMEPQYNVDDDDTDKPDDLNQLKSLIRLVPEDVETNCHRRSSVRIVRPRTAELDPDLKKRLEKFRELDSIAFIKPNATSPSDRSQRSNQIRRSFQSSSYSTTTQNTAIPHISRKVSNAARLLLARSASMTKKARDISTSPGSSLSSASKKLLSDINSSSSQSRCESRTNSARRPMSSRTIDSAHTFNPPSRTQVVDQNSFVIPKHRRPLSRGVRRFLADAVVEDSVHPKLGANALITLAELEKDYSISGAPNVKEKTPIQREKTAKFVSTDLLKKMESPEMKHRFVNSLHYHLHPPRIPSPGLTSEPYDYSAMNPPTSLFKLDIPRKLKQSLQDPRNLVGLEGAKVGGRIVMRKIFSLYEVPKCPRVNGRITPINACKENSNKQQIEPCDDEEMDIIAWPKNSTAESAEFVESNATGNMHTITYPTNKNETIGDIIKSMVFLDVPEDDTFEIRERHRKTRSEVRKSFENLVGNMFPLDYFMDQEEIDTLVHRVQNGKIRCLGLIQVPKILNHKDTRCSDVWHSGYITKYNPTLRQFRMDWDYPYPPKKEINYLNAPDPSVSSRWLSRAEIRLENVSEFFHLRQLKAANVFRAEFESKLIHAQIAGIVTPVLISALPEFPISVHALFHKQISLFQNRALVRTLRKNEANLEDIFSVQTSFLAEIINDLRDRYYLSQVHASISLNPRLRSLYLPLPLKNILGSDFKEIKSYSVDPERFVRIRRKIMESPFLIYRNTIEALITFFKEKMMLGIKMNDFLLKIETRQVIILKMALSPTVPIENRTKTPSNKSKNMNTNPSKKDVPSNTVLANVTKVSSKDLQRQPSSIDVHLSVENLGNAALDSVWSDSFVPRAYHTSRFEPLFDDTKKEVSIDTVVRKKICTMKMISLDNFNLVVNELFQAFKNGLYLSTNIASLEYKISNSNFDDFCKLESLSVKKAAKSKVPKQITKFGILDIAQSHLSMLVKERFMDLLRVLRDNELSIGVDLQLRVTPTTIGEKLKNISNTGLFQGSLKTNGLSSTSNLQNNAVLFPKAPFVQSVIIVSFPEMLHLKNSMNLIFNNWIEQYQFNLFPDVIPAVSQIKVNDIDLSEQSDEKIRTTSPIDYRALQMLAKEMIQDTFDSCSSFITDRLTLIQSWITEFEVSVKSGLLIVLQNMETVSIDDDKLTAEKVSQKPEDFAATLLALITGLTAAIKYLKLIEMRAEYSFQPQLHNGISKSGGFDHQRSSAITFEIRGFLAIRSSWLAAGVKGWCDRWRQWIEDCCQVVIKIICQKLITGCQIIEAIRSQNLEEWLKIVEERKTQTKRVQKASLHRVRSSTEPVKNAAKYSIPVPSLSNPTTSIGRKEARSKSQIEDRKVPPIDKPGDSLKDSQTLKVRLGSSKKMVPGVKESVKIQKPEDYKTWKIVADAVQNFECFLEAEVICIDITESLMKTWVCGKIQLKSLVDEEF